MRDALLFVAPLALFAALSAGCSRSRAVKNGPGTESPAAGATDNSKKPLGEAD